MKAGYILREFMITCYSHDKKYVDERLHELELRVSFGVTWGY